MENKDVYVKLRGEEESWDTTLLMTELDALRIQDLLQSTRSGMRIDLPSIEGFAEIDGRKLNLTYRDREFISVLLVSAWPVITDAIETAEKHRQSNIAWDLIWGWINERYEGARALSVAVGEQVDATLLKSEDDHVAVQLSNGSVAITTVMNEDEIPQIGRKVLLTLDEGRNTIIYAR